MGETDIAPAYREITLNYDGTDWTHKIKQPTEGQTVQMIGLTRAKGLNAQGVNKEQAAILNARAIKMVNVATALAEGLHYDPNEWGRLTMSMALGGADASVMYSVITQALDVWNPEPEPNNRAERRAAPAKKATRARRA
jgi:hypothetical protein